MSDTDLGGMYTVVRRTIVEALVKSDKRTTWTVQLRNTDGHSHTITGKSKKLWEDYPFGSEHALKQLSSQQTKLAVETIRREQKETLTEDVATASETEAEAEEA